MDKLLVFKSVLRPAAQLYLTGDLDGQRLDPDSVEYVYSAADVDEAQRQGGSVNAALIKQNRRLVEDLAHSEGDLVTSRMRAQGWHGELQKVKQQLTDSVNLLTTERQIQCKQAWTIAQSEDIIKGQVTEIKRLTDELVIAMHGRPTFNERALRDFAGVVVDGVEKLKKHKVVE